MVSRPSFLKETPSQTAGPYVHIGLTPSFSDISTVYETDLGAAMLTPETRGERIVITGRVFDGAGAPVSDAVIEIWQADAEGSYAGQHVPGSNSSPSFSGWGRKATDGEGRYRFETIKPGRVPAPDGAQMAPHVTFWIVARGINIGLHTRLYFEDEAEANAADPVLNRIMDARRRPTLIARRSQEGGQPTYALDIRLQGEGETVFFDI
jgi:protocatechuate 3,4-dioxygenase, alpha subunit